MQTTEDDLAMRKCGAAVCVLGLIAVVELQLCRLAEWEQGSWKRSLWRIALDMQDSMTTPGCATVKSPWWPPCPCPSEVLSSWWTSCWCAAGPWWSRECCCWPRLSCPAAWDLRSSLQPPESSPRWEATSSSAAMPLATQRQPWPGSKAQRALVSSPGQFLKKSNVSQNVKVWSSP